MYSKSKQKYSKQQSAQNRLIQTQVNKPPQNFEQTNNVPRPASGKQLPGNKIPSKIDSIKKIDYKIEDHMTDSRINQAKNGLVLLKKKMSRNGMSREKNSQQKISQPSIKELPQKETNYYKEETKESKIPVSKKVISNKQVPRVKQVQSPIPIKKSKPIQEEEYQNQIDVQPLNSNANFMQILEREMRKQKQSQIKQQIPQYNEENLVQCRKGCGRMFNQEVLPKHQKICQKVFQSKRKAFNSAAFRHAQTEGIKIQQIPQKKNQQKVVKQEKSKIPKWKLQSAQFRAGLKQGTGTKLTKQQKELTEIDTKTQCKFCGRKFNPTTAERHIPFCQKKAKQMPKMNTRKK